MGLGLRGERAAARALRRAGYRIIGRNVRTPVAEIDILAVVGTLLVLVEVKTSRGAAHPTGRLRHRQQRRLRRAGSWLLHGSSASRVRYDLVTVLVRGRTSQVRIRRGWF